MKVFDVLYKRAENDGVGLWSKCGVMLENGRCQERCRLF